MFENMISEDVERLSYLPLGQFIKIHSSSFCCNFLFAVFSHTTIVRYLKCPLWP